VIWRLVTESKSNGFSGSVTNISLPDLIQLLCIGRSTCRMQIRAGKQNGMIYFRDGEIIHAETGDLGGEEAFYEILSWETGVFEGDRVQAEKETIHENWDFLLMESVRRREKARGL
jgi:two-component system, chemotaxis family, protein-glutamate methylesterase/glutaminase